jgi:WD40 repeat protein
MTATVRPKRPGSAPGTDAYDCFLSYARDRDEGRAQAVRKGLAGLAKPWYRRRALRVFLDTASLSTSSELGGSIVDALGRSRFFILLASPAAARSPWVEREVAWWREHRDPHTFLIADCGADLNWDDRLGDFAADANVPPSLRGWFPAEPTWTDLSWTRGDHDLSLKNSRFSSHVADLAAPLRAMSKDALVDEDIRQHRRSLRLAWGAAAALLILTVAATVAAIVAVGQRREAVAQRDRARAGELAALAEASRSSNPLTSLRNATESLDIESTPEAVRALRRTLALPLRRVLNATERIDELQFSPDGRYLAQAARSGVGLWELRTGELVRPSRRGPTFTSDFSFDESGRRLASVGQIGSVNALQVADLKSRAGTQTVRFRNLSGGAISPDGRTVALTSWSGGLALNELRTDRTVVLDRRGVRHLLEFSPDGRQLLAAGRRELEIWPTGGSGRSVAIRSGALLAARFTPAGEVVGVASDGAVTTWSPTGTPLRRNRIEIGPDPSVALSRDGRLVAVGSGSSVTVWDLVSGGRRVIGRHPGGGITAVAFGPGDRSLASASEGDALIRIWDLETAPPWPVRDGGFLALTYTVSPDGALIAAAEDYGSAVAVWTRDGRSRRVFRGGDEVILAAAFTRDGRAILTVADDGSARLVDATTGRRSLVRSGLGRGYMAAISPDRRRVAVAVDGGPLRVWNLDGGPAVTLAPRTSGLYDLVFGAGGRVAAANGARQVRVWSVRGGPPVRLVAPEAIDQVEFAPSGDALAGGGGEAGAGVYLWQSIEPGARPLLLGRHLHFVNALAFSPDGSGVASAGDTDPLYLWPLDGGAGAAIAGGAGAGAIAFDSTGRTLALGGDGLRVLSCKACGPPARLIAEAQRLQRRGGLP